MRRWIAVAVLAVSLIGRISAGHEQPAGSLVANKKWVRFDLILGRLTATQIRGGHKNCAQKAGSTTGHGELLSVTGSNHSPSVRYERTDAEQSLTVEIVKRNSVRILREPQPGTDTTRLEFVQPRAGRLTILVGDPEQPTATASAESFWHLMLAEPELCRVELMPILELLRPHWNLMQSAKRVEANLLQAAADGDGVAMANVRQLVAELASPQFAERQQADEHLRALGVVVLTQFKQLDRANLSREQRERIDRIRHDMAVFKADTPDRIVAWLLNDQSVWLSMLSRRDVGKRQIAAERLAETHPAASNFDPLAEEALRRKQIDVLRLRISSRR